MKKNLILLICLLLVGCGVKENNPTDVNDISKFKEEYELLNETSVKMDINGKAKLEYLDSQEVIDLLENKTGIIYFGFPACPWCRNIIPVLLNVSVDNNYKVYYFNPKELRGTNDENFNKIMNILDEYLQTNSEGKKTLYVPDVYFVKDGNIVGHHLGSVDSQTNPYDILNDSQKQELYNIYNDLLGKIK